MKPIRSPAHHFERKIHFCRGTYTQHLISSLVRTEPTIDYHYSVFVIGLILGPAIALLLYHALVHSGTITLRTFAGTLLFVVALLLFSEFSKLELRLGLALGLLLGLLLATTPFQLTAFENSDTLIP